MYLYVIQLIIIIARLCILYSRYIIVVAFYNTFYSICFHLINVYIINSVNLANNAKRSIDNKLQVVLNYYGYTY